MSDPMTFNHKTGEVVRANPTSPPAGPHVAIGWVALFILIAITPALIIAAYRWAL